MIMFRPETPLDDVLATMRGGVNELKERFDRRELPGSKFMGQECLASIDTGLAYFENRDAS